MRSRQTINMSSAALWASAFVIAALVVVQAGRLPANEAHAAMATGAGGYTLVTANAGRGGKTQPNELLYVVDSRDQVLLVYELEDAQVPGSLVLRDGGSLVNLFRSARP